jgi:hypothetical protein
MVRIIKALILGWIGKKIYDFTLGRDETPPQVATRRTAGKGATRKGGAARPRRAAST